MGTALCAVACGVSSKGSGEATHLNRSLEARAPTGEDHCQHHETAGRMSGSRRQLRAQRTLVGGAEDAVAALGC